MTKKKSYISSNKCSNGHFVTNSESTNLGIFHNRSEVLYIFITMMYQEKNIMATLLLKVKILHIYI